MPTEETSKSVGNFVRVYLSQNWPQLPGNMISNAQGNESFAVYFTHLKLRREQKEDYVKVGDSEAGTGLQ